MSPLTCFPFPAGFAFCAFFWGRVGIKQKSPKSPLRMGLSLARWSCEGLVCANLNGQLRKQDFSLKHHKICPLALISTFASYIIF